MDLPSIATDIYRVGHIYRVGQPAFCFSMMISSIHQPVIFKDVETLRRLKYGQRGFEFLSDIDGY
jgi:hypothetical protein